MKWVRDDLVYTLTQAEQMIAAHSTRNKRGVGIDLDAFPSYRWPNPVPYKIDTMFTGESRRQANAVHLSAIWDNTALVQE